MLRDYVRLSNRSVMAAGRLADSRADLEARLRRGERPSSNRTVSAAIRVPGRLIDPTPGQSDQPAAHSDRIPASASGSVTMASWPVASSMARQPSVAVAMS